MVHKPTERVLKILNLLSTNNALTLTDISNKLKIPKSTLFPILAEMVEQNYLYLTPENNLYSIGISSIYVADAYNRTNQIMPFIKLTMKELTKQIGEICQLGKLDGDQVFYILKEEPDTNSPIRIISHVGKKIPAYCTALGKALLSQLSLSEIKKLYPPNKKLFPFTSKTITDPNKLYQVLEQIKKERIAREFEEVNDHLCCLAVPVQLSEKNFLAISVTLPAFSLSHEKEALIKAQLFSAKQQIESKYHMH